MHKKGYNTGQVVYVLWVGQCDPFMGSVSTPSLCVASSLYVELIGIGYVCTIPTRESFSLGARCGLYVISHVLKVMPRDIITQNVFYRLSMGKRLGLIHQDLERCRGFISKRHCAHMNESD